MNDLMSIIKGRRSIRLYQEKDIPEELLEQVLESIQWSPSWANTQCWEVVIVKDQKIKEAYKKLEKEQPTKGKARKFKNTKDIIKVLEGKALLTGPWDIIFPSALL